MTSLKKYSILVVVGLALAGGGYAAGRYAAPDKVVVTEKVVTVHDVQVVKVDETAQILAALKNVSQQKNVHKTTTTVKKPDGTVTTTTTTDDKSKTDTQVKTDVKTDIKSTEAVHQTDVTEKIVQKIVERDRPNWRLSVMPGVAAGSILGYGQAYTLLPSSQDLLKYMVVGVAVEHRFVGPLSAGVWANTRGDAGLALTLEW